MVSSMIFSPPLNSKLPLIHFFPLNLKFHLYRALINNLVIFQTETMLKERRFLLFSQQF